MRGKLSWLILVVIGMLSLLSISLVAAAPTGPSSITVANSTRYSTSTAGNVTAIAGNVTELRFNATSITNTWQGYYGSVSGMIVLGNSNNQSMYNWNLTSPSGQIYATRVATVPAWTTVRCANTTEINTEETALGVTQLTDADSVNRTFLNTTTFNAFYVGNVNINTSQNCFAVQLYNSSGISSSSFSETLLSDTTNMIYTGIITTPTLGFDGISHQFQMIVGENGHNGDASTTPYYFYVELS